MVYGEVENGNLSAAEMRERKAAQIGGGNAFGMFEEKYVPISERRIACLRKNILGGVPLNRPKEFDKVYVRYVGDLLDYRLCCSPCILAKFS
jgi:hypothetical protein